MDPKPTSARLVESITQAHLHLEKRPPAARPSEAQPLTIAISRDSGRERSFDRARRGRPAQLARL